MSKLLAIDIGGGTQDILLYDDTKTMENCLQLVLPSPTLLVAGKIRQASAKGKAIHLYGRLMGGGPSTKAIKDHLALGLTVSSTPNAALTIHDNLETVQEMGVMIMDEPPAYAEAVRLGDLDTEMLANILAQVGEKLPQEFAVAVQDHGFSPHESNRIFRFRIWDQFMRAGGKLSALAYRKVPPFLTRMQAVQAEVPGALMMDTCGAALLGALTDDIVKEAACDPIVVINLGNQHSFVAIVQDQQILGLFEHHTGKMTTEKLTGYIEMLCAGKLTNQEIQDDGGHGCIPPTRSLQVNLRVATGPRRGLLPPQDYYFAAPQGNMMLMGSFGLVAANLAHLPLRNNR